MPNPQAPPAQPTSLRQSRSRLGPLRRRRPRLHRGHRPGGVLSELGVGERMVRVRQGARQQLHIAAPAVALDSG